VKETEGRGKHKSKEERGKKREILRMYTECFKKNFTTLKAYINLSRGHVQCFELS
jgi:hypothetical protein